MESFGGHDLKRFLGSGSFGIVWEVDIGLALKVTPVDAEDEERQKRELEISMELNHENLVKILKVKKVEAQREDVIDLLPEDGSCKSILITLRRKGPIVEIFCITSELCGEDLRKWLKERHDANALATINTQNGIIQNMVEGLKYLHDKRIIHRDLKPENVMFSQTKFVLPVKIGDYGTCRIIKDPQTSTLTSAVGTDLYRAPEAFSNKYSFQSDLFSLGLILWEVGQLISQKDLRSYFDRLVNDGDADLVDENNFFEGFKNTVVQLSKKRVAERMQTLDGIKLLRSIGRETVAKTSEELTHILKTCQDDWTIHLLEGEYIGKFIMTKNFTKLVGKGESTVLRGDITVRAKEFNASNFCMKGNGWYDYCRINIHSAATRTKMTDLHFLDVPYPLHINAKDVSLANITMTNCIQGVKLSGVRNFSAQFLRISGPGVKEGIDIYRSAHVTISDVQITSTGIISPVRVNIGKPIATMFQKWGVGIRDCTKGSIQLERVVCKGFDGTEDYGLFIERSAEVPVSAIDCVLGKCKGANGLDRRVTEQPCKIEDLDAV